MGILERLKLKKLEKAKVELDDFQKVRKAFLKEANQIVEDRDPQGNPMLKVNIGSHVLTFHFNVNEEGEAKFRDLIVERYALKLDWGEVKVERR